MSYRDLILPNRGLEGILDSIARRLIALERRGTFPGAVQVQTVPYVEFPDDTWSEVASITLDPGRWSIVSTATLRTTAVNNVVQLDMPTIDSAPATTTALLSGFGFGSITLVVFGTISSDVQIEVPVEAWASTTGSGTAEAFSILMQASPF